MYTIGLIIPYFGKKPPMYDAWEITALANPTVDFYIFTDIEEIKEKNNIYVIRKSFNECRNMIQKVIDFDICLESPYKLCDYKPTFGLAFSKWLKNYEFWGYCDLDLLFGDLRKFFTDKVLEKVDRCLENGHISLWRNNEKLNNLFKFQEVEGVNYQDVYTSSDSFYFDEQAGVFTKCLINGVRFSAPVPLRDPLEHKEKFYYHSELPENQYVIYWENGTLYAVHFENQVELCYAHFFRRKFMVSLYKEKVRTIKIVPGKVIYNEDVDERDFQIAEEDGYNKRSRIALLMNNFKRYGICKMIYRQICSRKSNRYIQKIRNEYQLDKMEK